MLVAPGWVDVHTHYDGQATWDPVLAPSSWHGVTSVVMGNCGFGVAPTLPEHRDIIARFGRFPHRNRHLGRSNTAEEEAFLAGDAPRFGQ